MRTICRGINCNRTDTGGYGYCALHYQRLKRNGGAEIVRQRKERHGLVKSPEYKCWGGIINRCTNPNNPAYKHYGGRGIRVCIEWRNSFLSFRRDMGPRPGAEYSVERVNNDGNYEPGNCKWATWTEQSGNRRGALIVDFKGQPYRLSDLAREYGITYRLLRQRIMRDGMAPEKAVGFIYRR